MWRLGCGQGVSTGRWLCLATAPVACLVHAGQETGALVSGAAPSLQGNKFMVEFALIFFS